MRRQTASTIGPCRRTKAANAASSRRDRNRRSSCPSPSCWRAARSQCATPTLIRLLATHPPTRCTAFRWPSSNSGAGRRALIQDFRDGRQSRLTAEPLSGSLARRPFSPGDSLGAAASFLLEFLDPLRRLGLGHLVGNVLAGFLREGVYVGILGPGHRLITGLPLL